MLALGKNCDGILAPTGASSDAVSSWKLDFANAEKTRVGSVELPLKSFCELLVPRGLLSDEVRFEIPPTPALFVCCRFSSCISNMLVLRVISRR